MGTLRKGRGWILLLAGVGVLLGAAGCSLLGGGNDVQLTNWEPAVSPDGTLLAYESPVEKQLELFTRDLATGEVRQLTHDDADDFSPSWSPDGSLIAFTSGRQSNYDIYTLRLDDLSVTRLTTDEADDINACWAEDGTIYFNSDRSGTWEVFAIGPDGQNLVQITGSPAAE